MNGIFIRMSDMLCDISVNDRDQIEFWLVDSDWTRFSWKLIICDVMLVRMKGDEMICQLGGSSWTVCFSELMICNVILMLAMYDEIIC